MNHYFVIQDRNCHGIEFNSWQEVADFLHEMQTKNWAKWSEGRIVGLNCDPSDDFNPYYSEPC